MRFDPDSLSYTDWLSVEEVERSIVDPGGLEWPEGTSVLEKLVAWASWGLEVSEPAPELDAVGLQFDPDALMHGEWQVVREVEVRDVDPDGSRWQDDVTTLGRLVAWARAGLTVR